MKILFITPNRLGDAVLTTGVLSWLIENNTNAKITIACGPISAPLFRAVPGLEKIISLHKKKFNRHWFELFIECSTTKWDLIVDFRNSITSRLLMAKRKAYLPFANISKEHKVAENAKILGITPPPPPRIWSDDIAEEQALKLMPTGNPVIAIAPAANWPPKQWPIDKFSRLANRITGADGFLPGARILVTAAPHERELVLPFLQSFPKTQLIDTIGKDLLTVATCFKHCRLFIGNDSGLMHLAVAAGVPTLGLFGPSYENVYGPWGDKTAVARTPEKTEDLLALLPYRGAHYPNLMETLSVERVYRAAKDLFSKTEKT